ncbi:MAG: hypothetical protein LBR83_08350 [Clostridiales bacterium]|jgi:DNA-binding NarL/FixJ family response regulator|nr:hypothetical protein [Clostridiales bacterium]
MKKIGLITSNKLFAQSLTDAVKHYPSLEFDLRLLLNPGQATLDAEVQKIDVAVVDTTLTVLNGLTALQSFCGQLRQAAVRKIVLLVPQEDEAVMDAAIAAVKRKGADDYIFFNESLDYLFAKLLAL